jgi:hypothetical protein
VNLTCCRLSYSRESHSLLGEIQEELEMELLKETLKFCGFIIVKSEVFHAYVGIHIVTFRKELMGTALLIKEMSRNPLHR